MRHAPTEENSYTTLDSLCTRYNLRLTRAFDEYCNMLGYSDPMYKQIIWANSHGHILIYTDQERHILKTLLSE